MVKSCDISVKWKDYYKQYLYSFFCECEDFFKMRKLLSSSEKKLIKNHVYSWIMYVNEAVSIFKNTAVLLLSTVLS